MIDVKLTWPSSLRLRAPFAAKQVGMLSKSACLPIYSIGHVENYSSMLWLASFARAGDPRGRHG
eukprot:1146435-Pleurochrysis_carterae.AAC.1